MRMVAILLLALGASIGAAQPKPSTRFHPDQGDFVIKNYRFKSGETLPVVKLHYATLGKLVQDKNGNAQNAVLILHGTGGAHTQFFNDIFADELFGPGQPLDVTRYFVVIPDNIGHGQSSKPSDGLHAKFPHYEYEDMIRLQHQLLVEQLGVNRLRLVMGTSMGGMHSWLWAEMYPSFIEAAMPLASLPVAIAGRNRIWRKMVMDLIQTDPSWQNGEYKTQPFGNAAALDLLFFVGSAPLQIQMAAPTRDAADRYLDGYVKQRLPRLDANDLLYQVDSSRNYDPSPKLETIVAPLLAINSADDEINPPELGIAEREIKRVKHGRFVLLPISEKTRGHGTHTYAAVWKNYLLEFLKETEARIRQH